MTRHARFAVLALLLFSAACQQQPAASPSAMSSDQAATTKPAEETWRERFDVDRANLGPTGVNPYFSLMPGTVSTFRHDEDTLTITVLDETKVVDGVTTRVIEERETEDGELAEVSRNFFAIDRTTNDVYYFGEEVDIYKDGKIVRHEGAWLSGEKNARFGLMMPGNSKVGDRFYQEQAPGEAMDRAEIVAMDATIDTPAGHFEKCMRVKETSPLERGTSTKVYAPGIGLVMDDGILLTKSEQPKPGAR